MIVVQLGVTQAAQHLLKLISLRYVQPGNELRFETQSVLNPDSSEPGRKLECPLCQGQHKLQSHCPSGLSRWSF
jgi:hypothetical protein